MLHLLGSTLVRMEQEVVTRGVTAVTIGMNVTAVRAATVETVEGKGMIEMVVVTKAVTVGTTVMAVADMAAIATNVVAN